MIYCPGHPKQPLNFARFGLDSLRTIAVRSGRVFVGLKERVLPQVMHGH